MTDKAMLLELAENWERAAINHAYRISTTSHVPNRMPVSEMLKHAAALKARARSQETDDDSD